jgi:hypothetical protein
MASKARRSVRSAVKPGISEATSLQLTQEVRSPGDATGRDPPKTLKPDPNGLAVPDVLTDRAKVELFDSAVAENIARMSTLSTPMSAASRAGAGRDDPAACGGVITPTR